MGAASKKRGRFQPSPGADLSERDEDDQTDHEIEDRKVFSMVCGHNGCNNRKADNKVRNIVFPYCHDHSSSSMRLSTQTQRPKKASYKIQENNILVANKAATKATASANRAAVAQSKANDAHHAAELERLTGMTQDEISARLEVSEHKKAKARILRGHKKDKIPARLNVSERKKADVKSLQDQKKVHRVDAQAGRSRAAAEKRTANQGTANMAQGKKGKQVGKPRAATSLPIRASRASTRRTAITAKQAAAGIQAGDDNEVEDNQEDDEEEEEEEEDEDTNNDDG